MAETVAVQPEVIRWAIERSRLPSDKLAEQFPTLQLWISGEKQPTIRQLEDFAKTTMTPFGYLFLEHPIKETLSIPDFRTRGDTAIDRASPNLIDTIHMVEQRQAWMRDLLIEEGHDELSFVGSARSEENFKSLAQRIRQELDLPPDWAEPLATWEEALRTLRAAIERIGIFVFTDSRVGFSNARKLDPEEFRGFVKSDSFAPAMFVNSADTKSAQMFTLAHELVHVWLGSDGLFNLINMMPSHEEKEQFCNRVAAEFLVPAYKLTNRWQEAKATSEPFQTIARWFKVSPVVAARRALDLRLITKAEFFEFYKKDQEEWQKRKADRRERGGGDFYRNQDVRLGRRFASILVRAVREGRVPYVDAYRLTDLRGDTFKQYAGLVLERMKNERQ